MNTPTGTTTPDGAFDAVDYAKARDLPVARTEYTAADALAYVDDTESLRTPVERALAAEVHRLHGCCDQSGDDLAHMIVSTQPVADAWRAVRATETGAAQLARYRVQIGMGAEFVAALDEMIEAV